MESKLNEAALNEYCKSYSEKILDEYFRNNDYATGESILMLSEIKQVNLFVIYQLLRQWSLEISKLKSPYFDFKNKDVKNALKEFANILSRHIKVRKEELHPIFETAVHNTLLLILSPYDFYCTFISNWKESRVRQKDLKQLSKYTRINSGLIKSFISKLELQGHKALLTDEALAMLNEVFEETSQSPEEIDPFVTQFSAVIPLDVGLIYGEIAKDNDQIKSKEKLILDESKSNTLNDQLSKNQEKNTIAEIHEKKRIESIKNNLTINQKFMFVNQLFDGSTDDFNKVIDFLDNCPNQAEAMDFINNNYLKKSSWIKDSVEVKEFIEVIAKKYA